jgi:prepilin-type N-terminal cleavage/methylation domain-containing protein/prepilin-type processing-associated H-X9-DG protein
MFPKQLKKRSGFTLIELLVVIAIIAILIGLLVPAVQKVREAAARTQNINNMKQIALACHSANELQGRLPPLYQADVAGKSTYAKYAYGNVFFFLLPFIEQDNLYLEQGGAGYGPPNAWKTPAPGYTPQPNTPAVQLPVRVYISPMDSTVQGGVVSVTTTSDPNGNSYTADFGVANFAANYLAFGGGSTGWDNNAKIPATFKDGTSNTLLFATRYGICSNSAGVIGGSVWGGFPDGSSTPPHQTMPMFAFPFTLIPPTPQVAPRNGVDCDYTRPQAFTSGGSQVAFADGSARNMSATIDPGTWAAICTPANRDYVPGDF